jgi:prefoldin subunit 5
MNPDKPLNPEEKITSTPIEESEAISSDSIELNQEFDLGEKSPIEEAESTQAEIELNSLPIPESQIEQLIDKVADLDRQKDSLEAEIKTLQKNKAELFQQIAEAQTSLATIVEESTKELEKRRSELQTSVEQLERRRERIREEMRTTFAGVSQDLAIRVQGFKDYLVGSLQDLAVAAEQLELPTLEVQQFPQPKEIGTKTVEPTAQISKPQFTEQGFEEQARRIRAIIDQYRTMPDYYGPPWQLRRTFEPIHAERVQNWFFSQGGRGSIRSMGSRLQNILIASATISILHKIYGDRVRTLVLADSPERLGEWRRGLQDCLGISRSDFGPERGVVMFEAPEALVQKADRLVEEKKLPLVIIDMSEDSISLSLLQFPLWLAFAPDPQQMSSYMY